MAEHRNSEKLWLFRSLWLVPGEGFEPPTFGLQNRCTTAVLTRRRRCTYHEPGSPEITRGPANTPASQGCSHDM
jgi:hypothetical protein